MLTIRNLFRNPNIATRLLFWFGLVGLLPLTIVTVASYFIASQALTHQVNASLETIAEDKAQQIELYASERQKDVTILARQPAIADALEKFASAFQSGGIDSEEYVAADEEFRSYLADYTRGYGYEDLFLVSAPGDAVFSVNRGEDFGSNYYTGIYKNTELAKVFAQSQTLLSTDFSDFAYYPATNEPAAFIAAPVFKDDAMIGAVVLQINNIALYNTINDYTGLGLTGEVIVGSKVGDKIYYVAPLRNDPYAAFRRSVVVGSGVEAPVQKSITGVKGNAVALDYRGEETVATWRYLPGLRWGMVVKIDSEEAFAPIAALRNTAVGLTLGLLVVVLFLAALVSRSISRPIISLTDVARRISGGDLNAQAKVESRDEIGTLAETFNAMAAQVRDFIGTLESRVAERTRNLELAAEVGRTVSQVRALDVMMTDAVELIRKQFNLYYTQVYLTDPTQTFLNLQAGTGEVGKQLLARSHRLPLNIDSINGRAAVEKRSVVISNTTASATFRPNPLLPDTRSEMAVPLMVGEKVVGVLDMQSDHAGALSQEVLPAFEALAGQLAIAIQNASLLAETEQARAEVETQARRLVRANWEDYLDAIHKPEQTGYVFEGNKLSPLTEAEGLQSPAQENAISALISITGEPLGSLVVEMDAENQNPKNVELVNIVARQVAQQIESLRLLDSAERYRAESEQAAHRLTREGWKDYTDANAEKGLSYIYDLKEVRTYHQIEDQQAEESTLSLPLKVRDETVGRLVVQGLGADDTASLELANAVAERLGAHIESLRQFDQTQSALAQSEKLFEASRALTQAQDLQELTASTASLLDIPQINRAVLATFNYDPENNIDSLDILANWWNGKGQEATAVGTHYPLEVIRAMSFFVSPTPVFFNDTFTDPRADETTLQLAKRLNLRAVAVLPLYSGTRQIGALILEAEEPHTFTNKETRLFSALAPQIATVLENRRQFERAQKQAERESTLNIISQKIQGATTVEAVLQIAARELGHALGAPLTIAQLGMKEKK